jgi:HK97 family phage portal protein
MAFTFPFFQNKKKYREVEPHVSRRLIQMSGGRVVSPDTALEVSAYYRGLTYVSTQVAKLPWEIKSKNNEVIYNNIYHLLNVAPNPEMSAFDFKVSLIQQAISFGNGYAEIERNVLGQPVALWPMQSTDVQMMRYPDNSLGYRIIGGSSLNPGDDAYLLPKDVFHVKNFITSNGVIGQGVVSYAINTLGISLGADSFANGLYSNGGLPSGVLEVSGTLSDEAFGRLKESWKASHGGRKTGGTAILEEGIKYNPVSMSPDVLQFLESRKFNVLEIARFLGVPPTKLFDGDSATYNNIEHANLEVATDTLDAWARSLESEADIKLLNGRRGGVRTEFDMYAVFRGDMETRAKYFSSMMQNAAITPNEIRMKEGLAPYEGGDRHFVAINNFSPADRLDEIVDANIAKKTESSGGSDNTDASDVAVEAAVREYLLSKTKN